jgi:hypothetical protein
MQTTRGIFGSWENPKIIYITGAEPKVPDEIMERLQRRNWHISMTTNNIRSGFKALYEKKGSVLLVEDSPDLPAVFTLRNQVADPLAILTPTMVVCAEDNAATKTCLKEMGTPELIDAPMQPAIFIESLEFLLRRWSQGQLRKLTETKALLLKRKPGEAVKILTEVAGTHEIIPLAVPCLRHFIRKQADAKAVEKVLLNALREHPRNLGVIIVLVDFYLKAAMPETALKIIEATRKNHDDPQVIVPEQIQALLMLNRVNECIPLLQAMRAANFMPQVASKFLMRCLLAEGYNRRFEQLAAMDRHSIEQYQQDWSKHQLNQSA